MQRSNEAPAARQALNSESSAMPPQAAPEGSASQLPEHIPSGNPTPFASHMRPAAHGTGAASVMLSLRGLVDAAIEPTSQASPTSRPEAGMQTPMSGSDARTQASPSAQRHEANP